MNRLALIALLLVGLAPSTALAQETDSRTVTASLQGLYAITTGNLTKTAEMLDDEMYAFRTTDDVRTAGQILAHLANAQYAFCSVAGGVESPNKENLEQVKTSKADIVPALANAFTFCNGVYAGMSDADGAAMKSLFGSDMAASAILAFNSAHNYEHYGNLVTYMRMNGIVPPSSQQ